MDKWQHRSVSWLLACRSRPGSCYLILYSTEEDQWGIENVEFRTSAAIISASNGSHVALSQHLLGSLLSFVCLAAKTEEKTTTARTQARWHVTLWSLRNRSRYTI